MTTQPDASTRAAEAEAAKRPADAGRPPTPDEEAAAERAPADPARTEESYREMTERGAEQKGEGKPGV